MTDEEKVRRVWTPIHVADWYEGRGYAVQEWSVRLPSGWTSPVGDDPHDNRMWAAVAAFTESWLEQIKQLREEIAQQRDEWDYYLNISDVPEKAPIFRRTIVRLESILAEKTAGIRAEALK